MGGVSDGSNAEGAEYREHIDRSADGFVTDFGAELTPARFEYGVHPVEQFRERRRDEETSAN